MPTIAEQFLKTEQAAHALLEELERLREETQHYSAAARTLDAAGNSLGHLVQETSDLARGVHEVILTLREIGTTRIHECLATLGEEARAHTQRLCALETALGNQQAQLATMSQGAHECADQLRALERLLQDLAKALSITGQAIEVSIDTKQQAVQTVMEEALRNIRADGANIRTVTEEGFRSARAGSSELFKWVRMAVWMACASLLASTFALVVLLVIRN